MRVWDLEKYTCPGGRCQGLTAQDPFRQIVELTSYRWVLEIYQTTIGTLSSIAIVLLLFLVFA